MNSSDSPLVRLLKLLTISDRRLLSNATIHHTLKDAINHALKDITATNPLIIEFKSFLINIHDILANENTGTLLLSELYRVIRYCLFTTDFCDVIVSTEVHWIIVSSLEKEDKNNYLNERIQAVKIMKKFIDLSSNKFPEAFARSLVAISSQKDDYFRRLCLEILRELSVVNPDMTSRVNGFKVLLDAVIDPDIDDSLSETILISLLYLVNSSTSRQYGIDLLVLLSPLTDLDSDDSDMQPKWKKSIDAFICIMKTMPGIIILASDKMGLNILVRMLTDPKVSGNVQSTILDGIHELCIPLLARNTKISTKKKRNLPKDATNTTTSQSLLSNLGGGASSSSSSNNNQPNSPRILRESTTITPAKNSAPLGTPMTKTTSAFSLTSLFSRYTMSSPAPTQPQVKSTTQLVPPPISIPIERPVLERPISTERPSTGDRPSYERMGSVLLDRSVSIDKHERPAFDRMGSTLTSERPVSMERPRTMERPTSTLERMGSTFGLNVDRAVSSDNYGIEGNNFHRDSRKMSIAAFPASPLMPQQPQQEESTFDALYNAMDGYAAVLCCAFIHAQLFKSLCLLGALGDSSLMNKSKELLLDVLLIATRIFPATRCADFLRMPELVAFATSISSPHDPHSAHKASAFLVSIANEFSSSNMYRKKDSIVSNLVKDDYLIGSSGRRPSISEYRTLTSFRAMGTARRASTDENIRGRAVSLASPNDPPSPSQQPPIRLTRGSASLSFHDLATVMSEGTKSRSYSAGRFPEPRSLEASSFSTISEVAELMKNYCSNDKLDQETNFSSRVHSLVSPVDKVEFAKQMDRSQVIERDLKFEPLRWNWDIIRDIIDFSFDEPNSPSKHRSGVDLVSGRLGEAIKMKWIKRVTSFFRCSSEETSSFARIDWDPDNLIYVECGSTLHQILLRQGIITLSDRKGNLLDDVHRELDSLVLVAAGNEKKAPDSPKKMNVFSVDHCQRTLSREYITIIGKISLISQGKTALNDSKILKILERIGGHPSLDYLSRMTITTLLFTDNGGNPSKKLIEQWCGFAPGSDQFFAYQWNCTEELRLYIITLFRTMIHAREDDFNSWGLECLMNQMVNIQKYYGEKLLLLDSNYIGLLANVLEEAFKNRQLITNFFKTYANITSLLESIAAFNTADCESLLLRLLSVEEGLETLVKTGWLETTLEYWNNKKCYEYVHSLDTALAKALNRNYLNRIKPSTLNPITIPTSVYESANSNEDADTEQSVDIEGLFRMPWNIEIKLSTMNGAANLPSNIEDYIKTDCFLDTTELISPYKQDIICDTSRLVKIRAVVLDAKGLPSGYPVGSDKIIHSALLCGVCPVHKDGTIIQVSEATKVSAMNKMRKKINPSSNSSKLNNAMDTSNRGRSYSNTSSFLSSGTTKDAPSLLNSSSIMTSSIHGANPLHTKTSNLSAVLESPPSGELDNNVPKAAVRRSSLQVGLDHLYDWSLCKPGHRGIITELGEEKFSVEVPGEPVVWIFRRILPPLPGSKRSPRPISMKKDAAGALFTSGRADLSRAGCGFTYLVEVHYFLRLETKMALYVPCPRHIYGELAHSKEGCQMLADKNVLQNLLTTIRNEKADIIARRSALWSLGHICASSIGLLAVHNVDKDFITYILYLTTSSENFVLRGTAFFALGLIGKSNYGAQLLLKHQWETSPHKGSAVAVPADPSVLFTYNKGDDPINPRSRTEDMGLFRALYPFLAPGRVSLEIQVMSSISKLPGQVMNKESLMNLQRIKSQHPQVFEDRTLYIAAHKMLSTYTFSLSTRRTVLAFFAPSARIKSKSSIVKAPQNTQI